MADVVTAPAVARRLPVVERFGGRWQPGVDAEIMQQAIGIKSEHVVQGLLADAKQLRIKNLEIFQSERNGSRRWEHVLVR